MASAFADTVCVAGLDFGTDSVRCLLVDVHDGQEVAAAVANYLRWQNGDYSASAENRYRQHPLDYLEALQQAVSQAMVACPDAQVRAVCVDTTGSTPAPVTRLGQPLALLDEFVDDPDAMFFLWKDHTAIAEAGEITTAAREWAESGKGPDPTAWSGGAYSSEWFWAKMLGATRRNSRVAAAAHAWVEHCDWITGELTGTTAPESMLRSRCAAGHKAMWSEHHGGLPPADFLHGLDPRLVPMRQRMNGETWSSNVVAGPLSREWAKQLGWPEGIPVAVGLLDAHAAAVGAGIRPGSLVRVMGTSTCDMLLAHPDILADRQIGGISGQVVGSIIPGYVGLEAGQAAFGDVLAWFGRLLMWSGAGGNPAADLRQVLARLGEAAAQLPPEQPELALDWFNGRRSPNPDQSVKAAICGLTLGSDATRIYRALVESVAFGSRSIVEHFRANELAIDEVIAVGGVAHASDFVVQVLADVLEIPIKVPDIAHPSALGAAVFAAVAAGLHPNVEAAQRAMLEGRAIRTITPHSGNSAIYRNRYSRYLELASREEAASR